MSSPDYRKYLRSIILFMGLFLRAGYMVLVMGFVDAQAQVADPMVQPQGAPLLGQAAQQGDTDEFPRRPPPMPRILNDTLEYCIELSRDIARLRDRSGATSTHVALLTQEGERMCRIGHIRPGIYRLRIALMLLRQGD